MFVYVTILCSWLPFDGLKGLNPKCLIQNTRKISVSTVRVQKYFIKILISIDLHAFFNVQENHLRFFSVHAVKEKTVLVESKITGAICYSLP